LPESATECTPSASMDADPVIAAARNFAAATPRLAPNAVSTTRALLSADIEDGHHSGLRREPGYAGSVILGALSRCWRDFSPGSLRGGDDDRRARLRPQRAEVVVCAIGAVQEEQGLAGAGEIPGKSQGHWLLDTRVAGGYQDPATGSIT
jgi:hypothetical protein